MRSDVNQIERASLEFHNMPISGQWYLEQVFKKMRHKLHLAEEAPVYTDSVLCFGKMQDHSGANQRWHAHLEEFQQSNSYRELCGMDGEPIDFEWNIFPRLISLQIIQKIPKDLQDQNI